MKVALVHEFLIQLGGAERVLEALHELFPDAPVFTLIYDERRTEGKFSKWDIRTSFLQNLPRSQKNYKWYLPLMPKAMENFDLSLYDLVISDSSAFAKGIITKPPTIHICYCHTPTRYIWESRNEYIENSAVPAFLKNLARHYIKHSLQKWDYKAAQRPDFIIANSQTVRARIKRYYDRDSEVIYPPVDTAFFTRTREKDGYFLAASRLEPYKKIDLVIEAFNQIGLSLKVAGAGTEIEKLRAAAKPNIKFLGRVSDEELIDLYSGAKAFIFPALEDAGIMVLESLACGTPVIGLSSGGTAEFIRDGEHGVLMKEQTIDEISSAEKKLAMTKFDPEKLRARAQEFDKETFKEKISKFINNRFPSS